MRILHTADWHLGCKTDDFDRLEEQKYAINQLIEISRKKNVDMVIIAGDIYDTFVPSSDAEDLFYKAVSELNRNGDCAVIAIAGNHDEPKRMCNANIFSNKYGIYLIGNTDRQNIPLGDNGKNIYAVASDKGFIEFETRAGEHCVVAFLPFPSYSRYKEIKNEKNFSERVKEWFEPGLSAFRRDTINIAVSHLSTYAKDMSEDDYKIYTTISDNIPFINQEDIVSRATYTALGHIHKCLAVNRENNIYYSGALINKYFDQGDKLTKVIVADLNKDGVTRLEKMPLKVKCLKQFNVTSVLQAELCAQENPDDYLKIIIENVDRVSIEDIKRLRSSYKNIITLSVITKEAMKSSNIASKKDLTTGEIFDNFVLSKKGVLPKAEVKELFLSLMAEDIYETN